MEIIRRFENIVEQFGENIAIIDDKGTYTFKELHTRALNMANELSHCINQQTNIPIMISMKESFEYMAAIMGTFYSGNCYVPLILETPKLKKRKTIQSVDPTVIITDLEASSDLLKSGISVSNLLIVDEVLNKNGVEFPEGYRNIIDMDPAYIMHTSGSTGDSKGVVIQHKSLLDYIDWFGKTFGMNDQTIISCKNNFGFDNSVLDIFSCICYGSRIILKKNTVDKEQKDKEVVIQNYMRELIEELNSCHVNLVFVTPSLLKIFANHNGLDKDKPKYLEKILFCGEVMPNKQLNYWRHHLPSVQYANLYGPTEITDVCTYYIVDREFEDDESLPIGKPCENTEILILNESNKLVNVGETGEILVRGTGVSCGYWDKPEKTAEVFVQNPLHDDYEDICYRTGDIGTYNDRGEIMFIGRRDSQIQYHGTRVELGEYEAVLNTMEGISNCVALYVEESQKIIIFYEAGPGVEKLHLMRFLYKRISFMPSEFIRLDKFPYNTSGKVDRKNLFERLSVGGANDDD